MGFVEGQEKLSLPTGFSVAKVFKTGKIPWRNIRHFDLRGDDYYCCPHLYCLYADDGMPYEGFGYYLITNDDSYEFELPIATAWTWMFSWVFGKCSQDKTT